MNNFKRASQLTAKGIFVIVSCLLVGYINYQIISSWIGHDGPANLGSIEVSYVSMGRFLRDFGIPGGASWMPLWYIGFPFHIFYTPLLPFLEFVITKFSGITFWESYRLITGVSYILVPISLFFLGKRLSRTTLGGLTAAILYSVAPTIFYFILPSGEVAEDSISRVGILDPRRFTILVRWGEGPHTLSLVFLPLAGMFTDRYLKKKSEERLLLASIFIGLTALTNSLGLFALLILLASFCFSYLAIYPRKKKQTLLKFFVLGVTSLGLISFWYNFDFITNFFSEGKSAFGRYASLFPWGWLTALIGVLIFYWIITKVLKNVGIAVSLIWFLIIFTVVAVYYFSSPPELSELRIELLPQALRYNTEVDMAVSLLGGVLLGSFVKVLGKKNRILGVLGGLGVLGIAIVLGIYIQTFIPTATKAASQVVDLQKTREYEIAKWLDSHVDKKKGERVFIPGNYGFYLNYFTNVWQHRGGLFQASTHPWPEHIHYQLANGKDPEIALSWLRIINAKYAVITTAGSSEVYKEIKNLGRFESFEQIYSERGDIIYKVPLARESLAKTVNKDMIASLSVPKKGDDKSAILKYENWVSNSSQGLLEFEVINNDTYKIYGVVGKSEAVLLQMTYDDGWAAKNSLSGKTIKKQKDPLGFLILFPDEGTLNITLTHERTWKEWLGYLMTLLTISILIFYKFWGSKNAAKTKS